MDAIERLAAFFRELYDLLCLARYQLVVPLRNGVMNTQLHREARVVFQPDLSPSRDGALLPWETDQRARLVNEEPQ